MKKISEIRVVQTVRRLVRDEHGNRNYEILDFRLKYNPNVGSKIRGWAKLIDLIVFFIPLHFINTNYRPGMAVVLVILSGTITEHYYGKTVGKWLCKLRVVDDCGRNPSVLLSLKRNVLALANLLPDMTIPFRHPDMSNERWYTFDMKRNNTICKTYVIADKSMNEVVKLQNAEEEALEVA